MMLFLKLMLLFIISSHQKVKTNASGNQTTNNFEECKVWAETGFHDHIIKKETFKSVLERSKRPARLLPLKMFEICNIV